MTSQQDQLPCSQANGQSQDVSNSSKLDEFVVEVVNHKQESDSSPRCSCPASCSSGPVSYKQQQQMNSEGRREQKESSLHMPSEQEQRNKAIIEVGRLLAKMGDALMNQRRI